MRGRELLKRSSPKLVEREKHMRWSELYIAKIDISEFFRGKDRDIGDGALGD